MFHTSIFLIFLAAVTGCSKSKTKSDDNSTRVFNGVNINEATTAINGYRTQGSGAYPAVAALTWNDTLSTAAFNFAKARAQDAGTSPNSYTLSNGDFILDYPGKIGFHGQANFAFYYGYPSNSSVKTLIDAGFTQYANDNTVMSGFMSASGKQFGMGQFGDSWYIIIAQ